MKRRADPRERVIARLTAVTERLRGWELPEVTMAGGSYSRDGGAGDQGQEVVDRDLANADRERLLRTRALLEAALDRLDQGIYDECITCGEPIGDKRLEVIPEAVECRPCAEAREFRESSGMRPRGVLDEEDEDRC